MNLSVSGDLSVCTAIPYENCYTRFHPESVLLPNLFACLPRYSADRSKCGVACACLCWNGRQATYSSTPPRNLFFAGGVKTLPLDKPVTHKECGRGEDEIPSFPIWKLRAANPAFPDGHCYETGVIAGSPVTV